MRSNPGSKAFRFLHMKKRILAISISLCLIAGTISPGFSLQYSTEIYNPIDFDYIENKLASPDSSLSATQKSTIQDHLLQLYGSITVLNEHSYPTVGQYWIINFTTQGTHDLKIATVNGTLFGNAPPYDVEFVELYDGTSYLQPQMVDGKIMIADYSSQKTGQLKLKVHTAGPHHIMFEFGQSVAYAHNSASPKSTTKIASGTANGPTLADGNVFGISVAGIGDIDRDGIQDIAAGAELDDTGGTDRGAVYIILMNANGTPKSTITIASGTANGPTLVDGDNFGSSVAGIGDIDGDGIPDIAAGAFGDDTGGSDRGAVYIIPLTGDFPEGDGSVDATTKIASGTTNFVTLADFDFFGSSVAGIGDIDGDGIPDIAAGAELDDTGGSARGAVYIILMNANGTPKSTITIASGTANGPTLANGDNFGSSVAGIGDIDRDGIPDIAVGATGDDTEGSARGAVYIILMNANGTPKSTTKIASGTVHGPTLANGDRFGSSVAGIGDIDGDGIPDIAAGAKGDNTGGTDRGTVYIILMNADGTPKPTTKIESGTTNFVTLANSDFFGSSVAGIGDFDRDGIPDIAAGADGDSSAARGAVYIILMKADGTPKSTTKIASGTANGPTLADGDRFGVSVAGIGDIDRDGIPDIAAGADQDDTGGSNKGAVYIILMNANGTPKSTTKIASGTTNFVTLTDDDRFGSSVAGIGDIDGDGIPDIAAGAERDDTGGSFTGAVYNIFLVGAIMISLSDSISISDSVNVVITISSPDIESIEASDPDGAPAGYSDGDTITVRFSEPTNTPFKGTTNQLTKDDLVALFTFLQDLGADFTGTWLDSSTLRITITDSTGATPPAVGVLTLTVKATANLKDAGETTPASTDTSPTLTGDFGKRAGPFIRALVIDDPDAADTGSTIFDDGDVISVIFSESTNEPFKGTTNELTKADLENLFTDLTAFGADFTGTWVTPSLLKITIVNSAGGNPIIGQTTVTLKAGAGLQDDDEQSEVSTATSPPLSGNFGVFQQTIFVAGEGTFSTTLPSAQIIELTLPEGTAGGNITVTKDIADVPPGAVDFLADVIDIDPPGNQCQAFGDGCTVSFTFSQDDLDSLGIEVSQVRIFHDSSEDGDFDDEGEILDTTVVTVDTELFEASVIEKFTSKFAVGGVKALALGGGGGSAYAPSFTKPPPSFSFDTTLDSDGVPIVVKKIEFDMLDFENEVETEIIATGEHVEFRFAIFENSGGENIDHFEFLINLTGTLRAYHNSDTYIIYDEEPSIFWSDANQQEAIPTLTVKDPHGLFENVDFDIEPFGDYLAVVTLNITFANEMSESDIYLRMWDAERNSRDVIIKNAIEIIDMDPEPIADDIAMDPEPVAADIAMDPEPGVDDVKKVLNIPEWIKNSAEWWSEGEINDDTFVKGIEFLIQEQIIDIPLEANVSEVKDKNIKIFEEEKITQVPNWVKDTAGWWAEGLLSDKEFVNGIKYLVEQGIVQV